jgi:putative two-component system response regulator
VKSRILIVEDDTSLLEGMALILEDAGYQVTTAHNGKQGLERFRLQTPDLVISDVMMDEMDGFHMLDEMRKERAGSPLPFLFVSARSSRADMDTARRLGADDFLPKPFGAQELINAARARLDRWRVVHLAGTREAHLQTVILLAKAVEARDLYTGRHVERVRRYALALARELKWDDEALAVLDFGSLLHDLGKLSIPDALLNKNGPLTEDEWQLMRRHTDNGARMLAQVEHLRPAIPYVLAHHERWDGTGYPQGLVGTEIPIEGRLMAVADAFDALTTWRPYSMPHTPEEAFMKLREGAGSQWDPYLVEAFRGIFERGELSPILEMIDDSPEHAPAPSEG